MPESDSNLVKTVQINKSISGMNKSPTNWFDGGMINLCDLSGGQSRNRVGSV